MSESGAVYTVRVRPPRQTDKHLRFGAINESGATLIQALAGYVPELASDSDDLLSSVTGSTASVDKTELRAVLTQAQRGQAANIRGTDGALKARQHRVDANEIKLGALFRLPAKETTGWLCCHASGVRSIKQLLVEALRVRLREDLGLVLEVTPCGLGAAVRAAVEQDRVRAVTLTRLEAPTDIANASATKWIRGNEVGRLTLSLTGRSGVRLVPNLIRRFLTGQEDAFDQIIEYDGLEFTDAKVRVTLDSGQDRTFNINNPNSGFPLSQDLEGLMFDKNDDVTDVSLFRALGVVIDDLTGG